MLRCWGLLLKNNNLIKETHKLKQINNPYVTDKKIIIDKKNIPNFKKLFEEEAKMIEEKIKAEIEQKI